MLIREIRETDAEALTRLQVRLDEETKFMLFEPGERQIPLERQQKIIQETLQQDNSTLLVAEADSGELAGFLAAFGGRAQRNRHGAYLVIGILQAYQGQCVGTRLFQEVEKWALQAGLHRLELTVMTHNERGLALYQKRGFAIEGTKRHTLQIDGEYVDEHMMSKLLVR